MSFDTWIDTFINEKRINREQTLTVKGESGANMIPVGCVIEAMKQAPEREQSEIRDMLVALDVSNNDPLPFIRHLAKAIAI